MGLIDRTHREKSVHTCTPASVGHEQNSLGITGQFITLKPETANEIVNIRGLVKL